MIIKDYILINHAKLRMKERNISEKELERVLESSDISYPGRRGETNVAKEVEKGKNVRVTYVVKKKVPLKICILVLKMHWNISSNVINLQ